MKKSITLTKMLTLALLLVAFTTASASFDGDKCKTKCCKEKKNKEVAAAIAELEKEMDALKAELQNLPAVIVKTDTREALQVLRTIKLRPSAIIAFASTIETAEAASTVESKYKIDFSNIGKEMDQVQEKMTVATDASQKINFCDLENEMDKVQEDLSRIDAKL